MVKKFIEKEEIKKTLQEKYGKNRVFMISTEKFDLTTNPKKRNTNKGRSKWADEVVEQLYLGIERSQLEKEECNFSYIKFAQNNEGKIFGVVNGKSKFHHKYPSDVWFYDDFTGKDDLKKCMDDYNLQWDTKEILIIKNENPLNSSEAYANESKLHEMFNLYD